MTRDEILALKPGRHMDLVVANSIPDLAPYNKYHNVTAVAKFARFCDDWGWQLDRDPSDLWAELCWFWLYKDHPKVVCVGRVPRYSTNISAAWKVREWLKNNIGGVEIITVCDDLPELCRVWDGKKHVAAQGGEVPEAICKCALLVNLEAEAIHDV
jgi:hypothetical protein